MLVRFSTVLFLSLLCGLPICSAEVSYPDRLEILSQLENRRFDALEATMSAYHDSFVNNEGDERLLQFSLETLANSKSRIRKPVQRMASVADRMLIYLILLEHIIITLWPGHGVAIGGSKILQLADWEKDAEIFATCWLPMSPARVG